MPPSARLWNGVTVALVALTVSIGIHSDALPRPASRLAALPHVTLWAWERREDLHRLDTHRFAVAFLDQTLTIGFTVQTQPRRNELALPATAALIPVVRIEAPRTAVLDNANRADAVSAILTSARRSGIAALQIDFDATASQRSFYRDLLFDLRRQMPPALPLSITALASWCSQDDWLRGLPIDEAVPMMFRMEPDRRRAPPSIDEFQIREPLCRTSFGLSTTEPWPDDLSGKRLYIFADHGWQTDTPADLERRLP
ncbi:MAG TPA: DUF3142 domain-containing protein [Terracidiphilus sp.]|jgi:hypothetical protein|nr:DUF3142 domain-containing protein [Terracidiphilus sp.]